MNALFVLIFAAGFAALYVAASLAVRGWIFATLWGWFVPEITGWDKISVAQAAGIICIGWLFTTVQNPPDKADKKESRNIVTASWTVWIIALIAGWTIKSLFL